MSFAKTAPVWPTATSASNASNPFLGINRELLGEKQDDFTALGGFVIYMFGRFSETADPFESDGIRFEVVDMDRNRVDEVLIARLAAGQRANTAEH